jgi:glucokinase
VDVDTIAHRAADGDTVAQSVFDRAIGALGDALRPWLIRFGADVLVVGGGMATSWEIIEAPLRESLLHADTAPGPAWKGGTIVHSRDTEESNLVGAAWHALNAQTDMPADRGA